LNGARPRGAALISVIGPPAAGKTTLAGLLCEDLPASRIREDWRGNPFLAESYAGDARARLPGQMHFLLSRVWQLSALAWPEDGAFVSDYGFCQDRVFARRRLGSEEFAAYDAVAGRLCPLVRPPDVLIHLDATPRTLLARLAGRGRDFERAMDEEFLSGLRADYEIAAARAECPVIFFDCESADFRLPRVRFGLVERIRGELARRGATQVMKPVP
jgi:deoxyguanosine kinase